MHRKRTILDYFNSGSVDSPSCSENKSVKLVPFDMLNCPSEVKKSSKQPLKIKDDDRQLIIDAGQKNIGKQLCPMVHFFLFKFLKFTN